MYSIWVCLKDDHYKLASVDLSHPDMLTITFLALLITLNDVSGASLSDQVHQTPPEMVVAIESGPTVTLECSHSIKNYDQILWYKQLRNEKQLVFLGIPTAPGGPDSSSRAGRAEQPRSEPVLRASNPQPLHHPLVPALARKQPAGAHRHCLLQAADHRGFLYRQLLRRRGWREVV
ncbi:unnamed protein product [Arctogadus glacialis]